MTGKGSSRRRAMGMVTARELAAVMDRRGIRP